MKNHRRRPVHVGSSVLSGVWIGVAIVAIAGAGRTVPAADPAPDAMSRETAERAIELRQRALAAIGTKAWADARPLVDELVAIDPVADAHLLRAAVDVGQGRLDDALSALGETMRLGAGDPVTMIFFEQLSGGSEWDAIRSDPRFTALREAGERGRWSPARLEFGPAAGEAPMVWRGSGVENAYLAALRGKYRLDTIVAGCRGDMERVKMICTWVHTRWSHVGDASSQPDDPIGLLDAAAQGDNFRCVEYGITVAGCLNAVGIPARVVGGRSADVETRPIGAGHVFAEAWLADRGKWMFVDAQLDVVGERGGEPLNAVEFRNALVGPRPSFLYPDALALCMYYFDYAADGRYPLDVRGPGSVVLGPAGAPEPRVFQRVWPKAGDRYTHDPAVVYGPPAAPE